MNVNSLSRFKLFLLNQGLLILICYYFENLKLKSKIDNFEEQFEHHKYFDRLEWFSQYRS